MVQIKIVGPDKKDSMKAVCGDKHMFNLEL